MFKKFLALLLCICMITTLFAACNSTKNTSTDSGKETTSEESTTKAKKPNSEKNTEDANVNEVPTDDEEGTTEEHILSSEGLEYEISNDGTYATVIAYTGNSEHIIIASEYENVPVKAIAPRVFYENTQIKYYGSYDYDYYGGLPA